MARIEKKTNPGLFQKVLDGDKTFEVRLADFKCEPGDILILREWDPKTKDYTGRSIEKKVTFVFKTKNMEKLHTKEELEKYGLMVLAIK